MADTNEYPRPSDHRLLENAVIGMFVSVAIIILVWSFCWWRNLDPWSSQQVINVEFPEVAGLSQNAAVIIDGTRIGRVDKIDWEANNQVLVQLRISTPKLKVPTNSKFQILSDGLVGSKYVEIIIPDNTDPNTPLITQEVRVKGEMPARPELALQKITIGLSHLDPEQMVEHYREDRHRVIHAVDQLALLADKSIPVIEQALPIEKELLPLIRDMNKITGRLNKLLENPKMSRDLKDTIVQAQSTIASAKQLVIQINGMVHDKEIRTELRATMDKLEKSTDTMYHTVNMVQKLTENKELREDIKEILSKTRQTLDKADDLLEKPILKSDLRKTLSNAEEAVENINLASKQMTTILDKRFPLVRMMFGRPGHVKTETEKELRKEEKNEKKIEEKIEDKKVESEPKPDSEANPNLQLKPEIKPE